MKKLLLATLLLFILVSPVSAGKQTYSLSLDQAQPVSGEASFTITRTVTRSTKTEWLALDCYAANGDEISDTEIPVSWGQSNSLIGHAGPLPVSGTWCEAAVVTSLSYEAQNGDPEIIFSVTQ